MTTKVVFYSVTGRSRALAQGVVMTLKGSLYELTDRFSSRFAGWKRASRRAVRSLDMGVLVTAGVSFARGDRLVMVFPFWHGPIVPAVSGFVRSVSLEGVQVFLVVTRRLNGGDVLIAQLQDDIVRQGGTVGGVFKVRTLWRNHKRLQSLGKRIGRRSAREPEGVRSTLQELLADAIEGEVAARDRYLQLVEMTPNRRLKASLTSVAAGEAAHAQMLQGVYRLYSGTVYEPQRDPIVPLKPEQVLNYAAFIEGLNVTIELEHKTEAGYRAMAARYSSQPDVVDVGMVLARLEGRHLRDARRMYSALSRHRPLR
jgi:rubrerythrin